jgi:uncharacterized protein YndB with AHSA1/START domain
LITDRLVADKQVTGGSRPRRTAPEELSLRQTVQARTTIAAAPGAVFECLADYKQAEIFIEGLEQLTPLGSQTTGEGARFDAVLDVGVRTLRTTIGISSLEPPHGITWSSAADQGQSLTFELSQGSSGTAVSLTVTYERPGGVAGALLAPFVEHTVQHRATVALERLREHLSPA